MYFVAWLLLQGGFHPIELDPYIGDRLTAEQIEHLPSGRHLGYEADFYFLSLVNGQQELGGIAIFDPLWLSAHGRSYSQFHYALNGLSINDPAFPGQPLLVLPQGAWDTLEHRSLWTDEPGLAMTFSAQGAHRFRLQLTGGREIGGGLWLPPGLFDREPATAHGAPQARRGITGGGVAQLDLRFAPYLRVMADWTQQRQRYPVTLLAGDNRPLVDEGRRLTLLATGHLPNRLWPLDLTLGIQLLQRAYEGAQERWPLELTHNKQGYSLVLQSALGHLSTSRELSSALRMGGALAEHQWQRHGTGPLVQDVMLQHLWLQQPYASRAVRRGRLDLAYTAQVWPLDILCLGWHVRGSYAAITERLLESQAQGQVLTYLDQPTGDVGAQVWLRQGDWLRPIHRWHGQLRTSLDGQWYLGGHHKLHHLVGLDGGAVGPVGQVALGNLALAWGLAWQWRGAWGQWVALARQEPSHLHDMVGRQLHPDGHMGQQFRWEDGNGDGQFQEEERGPLLARTGGAYHLVTAHLRRPQNSHVSLAYTTPKLGPLLATFRLVARLQQDRMMFVYDDATLKSFRRVDSEGQLRGVDRNDRGGDSTPGHVFVRDLSSAGQELYLLKNDPSIHGWWGGELILFSVLQSSWFWRASASGYWNMGRAVMGLFSDRNDGDVLHGESADKNAQINDYSRYDHDRSYHVQLMGAYSPLRDCWLGLVGRFRDGQPLVRMGMADGLAQGPTPVMLSWRGSIRATFHMTIDAHVSYKLPLELPQQAGLYFILDVFNVLGSSTEINEELRGYRDDYRRSLEMVPDRTAFLSLRIDLPMPWHNRPIRVPSYYDWHEGSRDETVLPVP